MNENEETRGYPTDEELEAMYEYYEKRGEVA